MSQQSALAVFDYPSSASTSSVSTDNESINVVSVDSVSVDSVTADSVPGDSVPGDSASTFRTIEHCFIAGNRKNSALLWSPSEQQLYKFNTVSLIGLASV